MLEQSWDCSHNRSSHGLSPLVVSMQFFEHAFDFLDTLTHLFHPRNTTQLNENLLFPTPIENGWFEIGYFK